MRVIDMGVADENVPLEADRWHRYLRAPATHVAARRQTGRSRADLDVYITHLFIVRDKDLPELPRDKSGQKFSAIFSWISRFRQEKGLILKNNVVGPDPTAVLPALLLLLHMLSG